MVDKNKDVHILPKNDGWKPKIPYFSFYFSSYYYFILFFWGGDNIRISQWSQWLLISAQRLNERLPENVFCQNIVQLYYVQIEFRMFHKCCLFPGDLFPRTHFLYLEWCASSALKRMARFMASRRVTSVRVVEVQSFIGQSFAAKSLNTKVC